MSTVLRLQNMGQSVAHSISLMVSHVLSYFTYSISAAISPSQYFSCRLGVLILVAVAVPILIVIILAIVVVLLFLGRGSLRARLIFAFFEL